MSGDVVILTGPPGAGKTTLARRLASDAGGPTVHLVCDQFFDAIRTGYIAPWLPESRDQNRTVNEAIAAAAAAYARGSYRVLVDGVVGPWHLDIFRAAAAGCGVPLHYIVLRVSRETAVVRARDRAEGPLPDYPPNIFEGFADLGALERHVLDASVALPDLAGAALAALAAGEARLE